MAAYRAGRYLNQFLWHGQQGWLVRSAIGSNAAFETSCKCISDLALAARDVLTVPERESFQGAIVQLLDDWKHAFQSADHFEELEQANQYITDGLNSAQLLEELREDRCESLFETLRWIQRGLGERIQAGFGSEAYGAFCLGKCLDEGLRHPEVYRWMGPVPIQHNAAQGRGTTPNQQSVINPFSTVDPHAVWDKYDEDYLAPHNPKPGDIPPNTAWVLMLRKRCCELRIGSALQDRDYSRLQALVAGPPKPTKLAILIEKIGREIEDELESRLLDEAEDIPHDMWSDPLSLKDIAVALGYGSSRSARLKLHNQMKSGVIQFRSLNRQSHMISLKGLGPETRAKLRRTGQSSTRVDRRDR